MSATRRPSRAASGFAGGLAFALAGGAAAGAEFQEPAPAESSFFLWTDTSISLLPYGWGYEVDASEQSTVTLEHVHASTIGDFFGFIDFTDFHGSNGEESTWYGELGPRFSLGKLMDKDLSFTTFKKGVFEFKDLLIATQYERGEDPDIAEALLVGLGADLDVREGGFLGPLGKFNFIQFNVYARSELTSGTDNGFSDAQVTMVASRPVEIGGSSFLFDGYFDWVLGLGDEEMSFHFNPQVEYDIGERTDLGPGVLSVGLEFDFWWNKYQIPDSGAFDTDQAAVSLLLQYHF